MTTANLSAVQSAIRNNNRLSIHSFLRQSYQQVNKQVKESISYFKEEFRSMYEHAETCFNNMMLPVNNFLKDPTLIEKEFRQLAYNIPVSNTCCTIVPLEVALLSPMEENY